MDKKKFVIFCGCWSFGAVDRKRLRKKFQKKCIPNNVVTYHRPFSNLLYYAKKFISKKNSNNFLNRFFSRNLHFIFFDRILEIPEIRTIRDFGLGPLNRKIFIQFCFSLFCQVYQSCAHPGSNVHLPHSLHVLFDCRIVPRFFHFGVFFFYFSSFFFFTRLFFLLVQKLKKFADPYFFKFPNCTWALAASHSLPF